MEKYLKIRSILAGLFLLITPAMADTQAPPPPIQDSVVYMNVTDTEAHPKGHGTGFYIGRGIFITAAHVAKAGDIWVGNNHLRLIYMDSNTDIAFLRSDVDVAIPALPFDCDAELQSGQHVRLYGYPLNAGRMELQGWVAQEITSNDYWRSVFMVDATVLPGMSGGPVVDDAGNVVGVTVGVVIAGYGYAHAGYVVPMSTACSLS